MCDSLDEGFVGEIVLDKIRNRIPDWFDKHDSELLIGALDSESLDDTLEDIVESVEAKIRPRISSQVDNEFGPERIRFARSRDLKAETIELLKVFVDELEDDKRLEYEEIQGRIERLGFRRRELEAELKGLRKPRAKKGRK